MRPLALALALVLAWTAPLAAQDTPAPPLTLQEAVDLALSRHPAMQAAARRLEAAEARAGGAGAWPNPEVRLSAVRGDPDAGSNSLVQRMEVAGQPGLRSGAARAESDAARYRLEATRREVARGTASAWYELWETEALLGLASEGRDLATRLEETSARRLQAGAISQGAHLRAELELARAEADVAGARGRADAARTRLNLLLGRPEDALLVLPPSDSPRAPEIPAGLPGSATHLPEVEALRSEARAAHLESELAGRARAPELELSAYRSRLSGAPVEQGVQLSVLFPLWDYGRIAAEERSRRLEAEAREHDAEVEELELEGELATARHALHASRSRRAHLEGHAERARRLAHLAQRGYEAGLLTLAEVLDAQQAFRLAAADLVAAEAAVRQAEVELTWHDHGPRNPTPSLPLQPGGPTP